jgi:2-keto-4-pentenoate hydratase/2-oxohepta-3-ene-1,7-dioic acid hydratase in catechol pathway
MKWCRFQLGGSASYGLVEDDQVLEVEGNPFTGHKTTPRRHKLSEVKLLVPVIPGTFYAIGSNYHNHIVERAKVKGTAPKFYDRPRVGYRANSALIASGDDIVKPKDAGPRFEYEGELVAVLGKTVRKASPEACAEAIFGWTIGNDVTERDWQRDDPTNLRGKNADTFKPMGPYLVTGLDIRDMRTIVRLNDEVVHDFATADMLFNPGQVIAEIARYNTLSPGDVVWLGTDELPLAINPGDVVEVEITGIGVLRNRVVAEA